VRKLAIAILAAASLHAQISPTPPDAIVPVVGSTRGQSNAIFKTELQLANPTDGSMSGFLYLRPQGIARPYELEPHTTLSFADVVAELGATGLGSLDILAQSGGVPVIVARAFDDQPDGTTGATVPAIRAAEVLSRNDAAALIVPRDLVRYRFNAGVRTLDATTTLALTVRTADGEQRHSRSVTYPANHFEQQSANAFAGVTLQANDSIEIQIVAGAAIVYASTVDNQTNDSSVQILRK
jgi:hypothetical protein